MLQPTRPLQHPRQPFGALGAFAWLATLAAVTALAVLGRDTGNVPIATNPGTVATPAPTPPLTAQDGAAEPTTRIAVVHGPMGLAVGGGAVWVVTAADLRLRRIDPATNAVALIDLPFVPASPGATPLPTASGETAFASIAGGASPAGYDLLPLVAVGGGSVWVLGAPAPNVLIRVDPAARRVVSTIRLPAAGTGVVSGPAGTWVTTDAGLLIGIDTRRDEVGSTVRLGRGRVAAAVGTDATWVSAPDGRVVRLDERGRVTATVRGRGGGPIAVDAGSVWVRSARTLVQIDEHTRRSIARPDVEASARTSLGWGLPSVVTPDYRDTVARAAPREAWVAETARTLWLSRPDRGEVWRIERRVGHGALELGHLDRRGRRPA
jgi:hypothetical protein